MFYWVTQPWLGVALAVRDACVVLGLDQIDRVFMPDLPLIRPQHRNRETELADALGESKARAQVWIERAAWDQAPPPGLGQALARLKDALEPWPDIWGDVELELRRAGWECVDFGPLRPLSGADLPVPLHADGLRAELRRLEAATGQAFDAHHASGIAKNLLEATAKLLLDGIYEPTQLKKMAFPQLVATAADHVLTTDSTSHSKLGAALESMWIHGTEAMKQMGRVRNNIDGSGGHGAPVLSPDVDPDLVRYSVDITIAWVRLVLSKYAQEVEPPF